MALNLKAYLPLTRPPNLVTAISDIWAGAALSGYFLAENKTVLPLILLSAASVFLYAGGVVFNDVCDAELDAVERPERPIPSGVISKKEALIFTLILFLIGIIIAGLQSWGSGILAILIAIACVLYDRWAKPHVFLGPLTMGICRGLNLLLGMSILSYSYGISPWIAIVPILYIAAITLISRGEVHGGTRASLFTAFFLYILVVAAVIGVTLLSKKFLAPGIFLFLFIVFIFPPLLTAARTLSGKHIGKAVKAGVLGLILLNASWVAAVGAWEWAIATALLLPLSILISKRFDVT